jgi:integrase
VSLKLTRRQKSGNWYIRGTVRGLTVEESTGTSDRKRAEAYRIKREAEIWDRAVLGPAQTTKFIEAATSYMEVVKSHAQRKHVFALIQYFGDRLLKDIEQEDAHKMVSKLAGSLKSDSVRRMYLGPLQSVLIHAERTVKGYRAPRIDKRHWPASPGRVVRKTPEEMAAFLEACDERLRPWVIFRLYTGWRPGEADTLTWDDVRLAERLVITRDTKNGEHRITHLPEPAFEVLANLPTRTGSVFGWGGRSLRDYLWRRACKRIGWQDFRAHDVCHVWASWLRDGGADMKALVATGRWRSEKSASRYVHAPSGEVRDRLDALPKLGKNSGTAKAS